MDALELQSRIIHINDDSTAQDAGISAYSA